MMEILSPGVEHRDQADLGAEMLWIGGDDAQRLGRRREQDGVDGVLVVEGDLGDRGRQGEDEVEVGHRQQLGLAIGQPLGGSQPLTLRTVPVAAGIVGDADLAAVRTLLDMAAQSRRAAGFDGGHDAPLAGAQMAGMGGAVSGPVMAEDVRHLECGAHAGGLSLTTSPAADRAGWRWQR